MAKRTKTPAALDWRTGEGYPEYNSAQTDRWAWEFLRRNPDYRADWQRFLALADELRGSYSKPYDNLPDDWESDPGRPYWIISKADDEGDMRARVYDPPAMKGESESTYSNRIHASGRSGWKSRPLDRALGLRWGLDGIADPALSSLGMNHRWAFGPFGFCTPGAHRNNKESRWVYILDDLAGILRADPLPAGALQKARELLNQVPAAWDKRLAQMFEDNHPEKHGRYVVEFDLRVSIPEQLKHALGWLNHEQEQWGKRGGDVWSDGRRNKETPGYAIYLRALDAVEEIGDDNTTEWRKAIAAAMIPGYKPAATYDERKAHLDRVGTWVKRAKQLRGGEYRRLVAMAERPTIKEIQSERERKK